VKITSLFKNKAYAFPQSGNSEDDCAFAIKALEKIKPNLKVDDILLLGVKDYCDSFLLNTSQGLFKLKISLSDIDQLLKKEGTALRNMSKCPSVPQLVSQGSIKLGEDIEYILTKVIYGESIRDHGRSDLIERLDSFLECYWEIPNTKPTKQTYKKVLSRFADRLIPSNFLPEHSLEAVKDHTDYNRCEDLLQTLHADLWRCFGNVEDKLKYKCHANLSIDSIFVGNDSFYFDDLYNVCMGHPVIDFIDLTLEAGIPKSNEISLYRKFCEAGGQKIDDHLFYAFYDLQIRKKLTELLVGYITEVYIYDSYRYEKILFSADTFAHCYEKFCKIDIFKENREFIMKTICEPIFGVKA
jgi:hypothetical protein